ncbi:putative bifunctional diguanylate cyclase/phosphodiesterase [Methylobacterium sp. ID0610]|uniref:putative bifunctional diguanylate cyclase/phosphodiesterase n=1 Tax=Methylobacterium carpenticola TaxID=3344827 RepID=UPI0036825F85
MIDPIVCAGLAGQDEEDRLRELATYRVAATPPEPQIDCIAAVAAALCGTSWAAVTLIGEDTQWVKARFGLDFRLDMGEMPRSASFCDHTIRSDAVLVVPDAAADPRFRDTPLVRGEQGVRFYAGAPLIAPNGQRIGAICVFDPAPRAGLGAMERGRLADLARIVMAQFDLRRERLRDADVTRFAAATELALLSVDQAGRITFVNGAGERLFRYGPGEMLGRPVAIIVPERLRAGREGMACIPGQGRSHLVGKTIRVVGLCRDGTEIPVELTLSAWSGADGVGMGAVIRAVSDRPERSGHLLTLADHDAVTGLPNRRTFTEILAARLIEGAAAALLLHLEGLRDVAEDRGPAFGDALAQAASIRLLAALDSSATVARWDVDRVAVMVPDQDPARILALAARLQDAFATAFTIGGHAVHLGLSLGIAVGPLHGRDAEGVLANADLALSRARHGEGRGMRIYDPAMRAEIDSRRALQNELRRALEQGELVLHYQPQVALRTGEIVGAEALVRWQHPERGLLYPGDFLHAVESSTLALHLGWWTVDEVCRQIAAWRAAGLPPIRVALNLYAAQFRAGTLSQVIEEALARYGLPPSVLELEVTETIALQNDGTDLDPIRTLRDRGVGIAFDDFGTGYAALSTLKRFPLTKLKIDRSFVHDLLSEPHDEAIVGAVLSIGKRLDLDVVAEGIETIDHVAALLRMGCEHGQGFLFGRAMPPDAFAARLAAGVEAREACGLIRAVRA